MEFNSCELPIRYLGCLLHSRKVIVDEYSPLIGKIEKLIRCWSTKHLSYVGRLELIKSVVGGVMGFWSRLFLIPASVSKKIESVCKSFLWSGQSTGHKFLVAWSNVTLSFEEGGLGVKKILSWNKTNYMKPAMDIICDNPNLWRRWVAQNHTRGRPLDEIQAGETDSWLWR